jgi:hypothetical protein
MKKLVTFFQWAFIIILLGTGLLTTWLALVNIIVVQQQKKIEPVEKKIEQEIEAFAREFPPTDFNHTANQLRQLTPKLGFNLMGIPPKGRTQFSDEQLNIKVDESNYLAWREIYQVIEDYLDEQFSQPDDSIMPPPKELQDYLTKNSATLEAIRDILLNQQTPVWWSDITPILEGDYLSPLPSYLGIMYLQQILVLDILEKQRQGKTSEAISMLEVFWKLTEDLQDHPAPIEQGISLISTRYLSGTIRKLDNLPEPWQQRLVEHDYWQSGFTAIEAEIFGRFNQIRNPLRVSNFESLATAPNLFPITSYKHWIYNNKYFWRMLDVIVESESYSRLSAVDTYQFEISKLEQILKLQEYKVCQSEPLDIGEQEAAWWNLFGLATPNFLSQVTKAQKSMLDLELTQKILQVKEQAAKTGKWPETVDNLESDICPGFTWVYQVAEDGTMSLSLSQEPDWQADRLKYSNGLPLTYRDRTISQAKVSRK